MLNSKLGRPSLKTVLKTSTVAGLAAVMLSTGIPAQVVESFADPVKVQAPQAPSFADVVSAVSPAVVSVRVQSEAQPVSGNSNFSFNFGGQGFENLPDDHPLKRFFREFGGPEGRRGGHRAARGRGDRANRPQRMRPPPPG